MKKTMMCLMVFFTALASCDKETLSVNSDCVKLSENTDWTSENLKINFSIQFPDNYEGIGMTGFEGNIFHKNRLDDKVELSYSFCDETYCEDFGDALEENIPNSITAKDKANFDVTLASKKEFCLNDNVEGVLYYNTEINSTGKYFMKVDSEYFEGLTIYFDNSEYQEVENIIKTIIGD